MYSFSTSRSLKLPSELGVRGVVLGDHHQSRRPAIEPVHDPRPLLAADAAEVVDVMEECVDQRPGRMAGGRMHDHSRRLVDHDEVAVLKENRQWQRLRLRRRFERLRNVDGDDLSRLDRLIGFGAAARHLDRALLDQALDVRSRLIGQNRCEEAVEANAVTVVGDGDPHAALRARFGSGAPARER